MSLMIVGAEFDDVSGSELNPLLTALKVIKTEYRHVKPEVYRTLIAILYDYKPEHRTQVPLHWNTATSSYSIASLPEFGDQRLDGFESVISLNSFQFQMDSGHFGHFDNCFWTRNWSSHKTQLNELLHCVMAVDSWTQ